MKTRAVILGMTALFLGSDLSQASDKVKDAVYLPSRQTAYLKIKKRVAYPKGDYIDVTLENGKVIKMWMADNHQANLFANAWENNRCHDGLKDKNGNEAYPTDFKIVLDFDPNAKAIRIPLPFGKEISTREEDLRYDRLKIQMNGKKYSMEEFIPLIRECYEPGESRYDGWNGPFLRMYDATFGKKKTGQTGSYKQSSLPDQDEESVSTQATIPSDKGGSSPESAPTYQIATDPAASGT